MRVLLALLLVVGCAKKAAETGARNTEAVGGAPNASAGSSAGSSAVTADTTQSTTIEVAKAPPPPPPPGGGPPPTGGGPVNKGGEGGGSAIDQARGTGVLGPTDQHAFQVTGKVSIKSTTMKAIDELLTPKLDKLQACYDKALEFKDTLAGELSLTVKDGKATVAKTSLKNAELETCVVDALAEMKLPKGKATLVLSFKRE